MGVCVFVIVCMCASVGDSVYVPVRIVAKRSYEHGLCMGACYISLLFMFLFLLTRVLLFTSYAWFINFLCVVY